MGWGCTPSACLCSVGAVAGQSWGVRKQAVPRCPDLFTGTKGLVESGAKYRKESEREENRACGEVLVKPARSHP